MMNKNLLTTALFLIMSTMFALSQNVGISTNISFNPQYTLDVDGIFKVSNYAAVGVNPNSSYRFYAYNSSNNYARLGSNQYGVYARGSSSAVWGMNSTIGGHAVRAEQTSTGYAIYADGVSSRNYFQGNVGIGSLSPNSKLEVIGSASGEISSAIYGELDITDAQGIGVVGVGGYNGIQGNVFPIGNQTYYGTSGNVISTSGVGTNIGIYGRAEGGGLNYAGYFLGDVLVTGLGGGGLKGVAADVNGLLRPTSGIGTAPIRVCTTTTTPNATTPVTVVVWYGSWSSENSWDIRNSSGTSVLSGGSCPLSDCNNSFRYNGTINLGPGTYTFYAYDSYGDGWNGGGYLYATPSSGSGTGTQYPSGTGGSWNFTVNQTSTTSTTCSDQSRLQRLIRGTVNADGSIAGGGGFSVAKDGAGRYRITFATLFADIPSASATQIFTGVGSVAATNSGSTLDNAVIYGISSSGINIATGDGSGNRGDRAFSFIIVGSE
jgi:hypothetical protein